MNALQKIINEIQGIVESGGYDRVSDDKEHFNNKRPNPFIAGSYSAQSIEARAWQYGYDNRVRSLRLAIHQVLKPRPCDSISRYGYRCGRPHGHGGMHHAFSDGMAWTDEQQSVDSMKTSPYAELEAYKRWPPHPRNCTCMFCCAVAWQSAPEMWREMFARPDLIINDYEVSG